MFHLSLLLLGFAGLLLAQVGQPELKIDYFYQNQFLSNGPSVVFEFKLTGCQGAGPFGEAKIDFGDGQQETIPRLTCERFRVPHIYYTDAKEAKLTVGGETRLAPLFLTVIATPPPVQRPTPPTAPPTQPLPPGGQPPPASSQTTTYQLILLNSSQGLAAYGAVITLGEGKITDVKSIFFQTFRKNECSAASCDFSAIVNTKSQAETKRPLTNQPLAEIVVSGQAELKLERIFAQDCPAPDNFCRGNRVIPAANFKIEKK